MLSALRTIFVAGSLAIMAYWLLTVADDVRRAGALTMSDLQEATVLGMLIYLGVAELRRRAKAN